MKTDSAAPWLDWLASPTRGRALGCVCPDGTGCWWWAVAATSEGGWADTHRAAWAEVNRRLHPKEKG